LVLELEDTRSSTFQLGLPFDLQQEVLFSEEGFKLFDCHFIRIHCSVEEDGVGGPTQRQCTNVGGQFASKSSLPCLPLTSIVDGDTSLGGFLRPATPAPLLSFLVEKALMNDYMFSSLLCL
jgi:hypothetical protein